MSKVWLALILVSRTFHRIVLLLIRIEVYLHFFIPLFFYFPIWTAASSLNFLSGGVGDCILTKKGKGLIGEKYLSTICRVYQMPSDP